MSYKPTLKHQAACAIRRNVKDNSEATPNEALHGVDYWELCEAEFNGDEEAMRVWVRGRLGAA